ncbi:hypothetical protein [Brevibacillus reuszeri]|uniref:hypothetical protein n=1 Tax=Brevibacillus reuszeri TaxID=54915 RepID=UPI00289F0A24|nr:hypothetical protein [Brevibacillus reuszeri]
MKKGLKTLAAILCSSGLLIASGLGADPVYANTGKTQTYASMVLLQSQHNIPFSIHFLDGFKVKVTNNRTNAVNTFDVSANQSEYFRLGVYQGNGKLQNATTGFAQKLVQLVPFTDANGNLRWKGQQTLWGVNGEDRIAVATSVWNIVNNQPQLLGVTVQPGNFDNLPSSDIEINSGFSMGRDITFVLDTKYADVTGDGVKDQILLVGDKMGSAMNIPAENLRIVVREGKNNQQSFISVGERDSGVLPKLSISDANLDQIPDILVTMPTSTGRVYSQFTWKDNHPAVVVEQQRLNDRSLFQPVNDGNGETISMKAIK